jgi:hypothetical protein
MIRRGARGLVQLVLLTDDAVQVDKRAAAWFFYTMYPKVLDEHAATVYLAPSPRKSAFIDTKRATLRTLSDAAKRTKQY